MLLAALLVADPSWVPAALLAATAAAAAGCALVGAFSGRRMGAAIAVPGHAVKGGSADCALEVRNASLLPIWRAVVPVSVENPVTGEYAVLSLPVSAGPHATARVPFRLESPHCGALALACEDAWPQDILGIVRRKRALSASARIAVPPAAAPYATQRSGARAHDIESFTYSPDRPGDDPGETFSVREYEPGDAVRRIHWKLSGKLGATMVRESGFPIYSSLLLLVETGWDAPGPVPEAADAQMEAATSIMMALLSADVAFELAFLDRSSGSVVVRRVADMSALWDAVGMLMAAPREEAPEGSIQAFLEQAGDTVWAHTVYCTAGTVGADARALAAGGGKLTVLRCMAASPDATDSTAPAVAGGTVYRDGYEEVAFAPETWQDDLEEVVL